MPAQASALFPVFAVLEKQTEATSQGQISVVGETVSIACAKTHIGLMTSLLAEFPTGSSTTTGADSLSMCMQSTVLFCNQEPRVHWFSNGSFSQSMNVCRSGYGG